MAHGSKRGNQFPASIIAMGMVMSRPTEGGTTAGQPPRKDRTVTQGEIKGLCDLDAEVKRRRAEIEAKLREGWTVEEGDFFAMVEKTMAKGSCTKKHLVEQLGEETAQSVWEKIGSKPRESFKYGKQDDNGAPKDE